MHVCVEQYTYFIIESYIGNETRGFKMYTYTYINT